MRNYAGRYPMLAKKIQRILSELQPSADAGPVRHPVAAAFVIGGELVAAAGAGVDGFTGKPVLIDSLFNVGSVSKLYCAAALLHLVETGSVSLDDFVCDILPDFTMADERYKKIKVHMTLDHTSGLPGTNFTNFYGPRWKFERNIDEMYEYWRNAKLKAEPGEFAVYCNDGFELAAAIIECRTGMTYGQYLRKNILDPLGADATGIGPDGLDQGPLAAMPGRTREFVSVAGAGGVHSDVIGCARFGSLFLDSRGIVRQDLLDLTKKPWGKTFLKTDTCSPQYGLGWDDVGYVSRYADLGKGALTKNGSSRQFGTQLTLVPKYNLSAVVSMTHGYAQEPAEILDRLIAGFLKDLGIADIAKPAPPEPVGRPIPEELSAHIEGVYYSGPGIFRVRTEGSALSVQLLAGPDRWKDNPYVPDAVYDGSRFVTGRGDVSFEDARSATYLLFDGCPYAQKVPSAPPLNEGWKKRIGKKYVAVNLPVSEFYTGSGAGIEVCDLFGDGVLSFASPSRPGGDVLYYTAVCGKNPDDTELFLDAPGAGSRDVWAFFVTRDEEGYETLARLNYRYVETAALKPLQSGEIVIEPGFHNAVFAVKAGTRLRCDLPDDTRVIVLNDKLETVYSNAFGMDWPEVLPDGFILFCSDEGCVLSADIS